MTFMSVRETLGLVLVTVWIATAPLAYFVGSPWVWVALVTGVTGAALFFTDRIRRRIRKDDATTPEAGGDLKGFPGYRVFRDADDVDGD